MSRSVPPDASASTSSVSQHNFELRRARLLPILERERVDLFLVTCETNVRYLTGFSGDSTYLVAGPQTAIVVSDARYEAQLGEECPNLEARIRPPHVKLHEATVALLKELRPRRVGFEGHVVSVELRDLLAERLEGIELVPISSAIEAELRAIKDDGEISEIRRAIAAAIEGFVIVRRMLTSGISERGCAFELEAAVRRAGAEGLSFPAIVAVGDRAALPHYRAGARRLDAAPLVLIDWGAEMPGGYKSDLSRTLWRGRLDSRFTDVYTVVLRAQQAAIAAIRPGKTGIEVDRIAREIIREAGYGERFGHSLGHGIGLEIHEHPRLAPNSDAALQPGMVVTVEPGIYLPAWGGVRIEDDVLVTDSGSEVLSRGLSTRLDDMLIPQ